MQYSIITDDVELGEDVNMNLRLDAVDYFVARSTDGATFVPIGVP